MPPTLSTEWAKANRMLTVTAVALALVLSGTVALAAGSPKASVALSGAAFVVGAGNVVYYFVG